MTEAEREALIRSAVSSIVKSLQGLSHTELLECCAWTLMMLRSAFDLLKELHTCKCGKGPHTPLCRQATAAMEQIRKLGCF